MNTYSYYGHKINVAVPCNLLIVGTMHVQVHTIPCMGSYKHVYSSVAEACTVSGSLAWMAFLGFESSYFCPIVNC